MSNNSIDHDIIELRNKFKTNSVKFNSFMSKLNAKYKKNANRINPEIVNEKIHHPEIKQINSNDKLMQTNSKVGKPPKTNMSMTHTDFSNGDSKMYKKYKNKANQKPPIENNRQNENNEISSKKSIIPVSMMKSQSFCQKDNNNISRSSLNHPFATEEDNKNIDRYLNESHKNIMVQYDKMLKKITKKGRKQSLIKPNQLTNKNIIKVKTDNFLKDKIIRDKSALNVSTGSIQIMNVPTKNPIKCKEIFQTNNDLELMDNVLFEKSEKKQNSSDVKSKFELIDLESDHTINKSKNPRPKIAEQSSTFNLDEDQPSPQPMRKSSTPTNISVRNNSHLNFNRTGSHFNFRNIQCAVVTLDASMSLSTNLSKSLTAKSISNTNTTASSRVSLKSKRSVRSFTNLHSSKSRLSVDQKLNNKDLFEDSVVRNTLQKYDSKSKSKQSSISLIGNLSARILRNGSVSELMMSPPMSPKIKSTLSIDLKPSYKEKEKKKEHIFVHEVQDASNQESSYDDIRRDESQYLILSQNSVFNSNV